MSFEEIKRNFGFGCMRLPMKKDEGGTKVKEVDYEHFSAMIDEFINQGFNYFDTAHGYLDGKSEIALRECLVKRHKREDFLLADKLSSFCFKTEEEIRPFFEKQLEICGVEYFDFYLMHAQTANFYKKFKACRAYETAFELKKEGKIRHVGLSFHDTPEVLDTILTENPSIEFVMIQFNYLDFEDAKIQSRKCYEVIRKHGKPVFVMEPVKGGMLSNLPKKAGVILDGLKGGSHASYAIRFAAGFDGVAMTLSGMSTLDQLKDNIAFMKDFKPLTKQEAAAVEVTRDICAALKPVGCTECGYCVADCPQKILIPKLLFGLNAKTIYKDWNSEWYYTLNTLNRGKASDCIACGKCEGVCPQRLKIRELLKKTAAAFEEKQ